MTVARKLLACAVIFCLVHVDVCEKEPVDVEDRQNAAIPHAPIKQHILPANGSNLEFGDFKRPAPIFDQYKDKELGFVHAFLAAVSVIVVSELGDKTFFIAAIMAMRHARLTVFLGAILALAVMTILSACLGFAITVIPRIYTYYVSTALFAIFGIKMLKEGYSMSPTEGQEEFDEVQADLRRRDDEIQKASQEHLLSDVEATVTRGAKRKIFAYISAVFVQAFTLTFLAEWGDRSQLTTIILAARENAIGVTLGGILGHALCTALAVIGGKIVAQRISVRTVTIIGGVVFIAFALSAFIFSPLD